MDCCLSYAKFRFPSLPAGVLRRPITFYLRAPLIVAASTAKCEFGGLNAPLEPRTSAGRFLTGVLLDDSHNFQVAARKELERLAAERDGAAARLQLSFGSDEACLHRMEIWPSKDWELESIHSVEVLQMVREHLTAILGCKANSGVTDSWAKISIQRLRLCRMYAASILYGYFLMSASLRYRLEQGYASNSQFGLGVLGQRPVSEIFYSGSKYIACGRVGSPKSAPVGRVSYTLDTKPENLRLYVMGFDPETIQNCAKPKTKEAVNLIERHSCALFGDEETGLLESDDDITTSFASLKRFLLEAVAFGSFLWDAENFVNSVYMLEEQ